MSTNPSFGGARSTNPSSTSNRHMMKVHSRHRHFDHLRPPIIPRVVNFVPDAPAASDTVSVDVPAMPTNDAPRNDAPHSIERYIVRPIELPSVTTTTTTTKTPSLEEDEELLAAIAASLLENQPHSGSSSSSSSDDDVAEQKEAVTPTFPQHPCFGSDWSRMFAPHFDRPHGGCHRGGHFSPEHHRHHRRDDDSPDPLTRHGPHASQMFPFVDNVRHVHHSRGPHGFHRGPHEHHGPHSPHDFLGPHFHAPPPPHNHPMMGGPWGPHPILGRGGHHGHHGHRLPGGPCDSNIPAPELPGFAEVHGWRHHHGFGRHGLGRHCHRGGKPESLNENDTTQSAPTTAAAPEQPSASASTSMPSPQPNLPIEQLFGCLFSKLIVPALAAATAASAAAMATADTNDATPTTTSTSAAPPRLDEMIQSVLATFLAGGVVPTTATTPTATPAATPTATPVDATTTTTGSTEEVVQVEPAEAATTTPSQPLVEPTATAAESVEAVGDVVVVATVPAIIVPNEQVSTTPVAAVTVPSVVENTSESTQSPAVPAAAAALANDDHIMVRLFRYYDKLSTRQRQLKEHLSTISSTSGNYATIEANIAKLEIMKQRVKLLLDEHFDKEEAALEADFGF